MTNDLNITARRLRALHDDGVLVLPNAWDPASAVLIAAAGAPAIATTSAGVSWAHGRGDGQHLDRDEMVRAIAGITAVVDVPVTADIEGGYDDLAATVRAVVAAGAAGINLEDSKSDGSLFSASEQGERLGAARAAAVDAGVPDLVINARTDVYLFGVGEPEGRFDDVVARAGAYADADCLFVPGLLDLGVLKALVDAVQLPVNAMLLPGGPTVAELAAAGVRRVSAGSMLAQVAYSATRRLAAELLTTGTYAVADQALGFGEVNEAFSRLGPR
ncbi:isocitrate lyase/PEP mutase family protein [Flindersiella endophytica]